MISALECLHFAILELVRSTPIKQRLICAYRRHLSALREDELPGEARELFNQVLRVLQGVHPQRGEDAVAASVRKMSNQEADDCASLIVEVFMLCRLHAGAHRPASVVQLHSVECAPPEYHTALVARS